MGYIVRMPKLGLEMESGVLLEWYVEKGETFQEGDVLAEVESEKSIGEVEAREDGALREVYLEEGGEVPPSTPIGIVAAPDADVSDLEAEAEADLAETEESADATPEEAATAEATTTRGSDAASDEPTSGTAGSDANIKASPRAKQRAEELGVDLSNVDGTGFDGAITEADVESAAKREDAAAESTEEIRASPRAKQRAEELNVALEAIDGTGFDGAITEADVERAAEAEGSTPADAESTGVRWITGEIGADRYGRTRAVADPVAGEALLEATEAVRTAFEERVTITDVLVVVATATLEDRPLLNGTYAESTHQVHQTKDVALVTDVGGEPVAGVIPDAGTRSLAEVIEARQALDGTEGAANSATFTLANAAETDVGGRLVNPPGVAALVIDPTGQRAVPDGDSVDLQPLVTASLTYDSRAVGEVEAAAFLERFFERTTEAPGLVLNSYRGTE